MTFILRALLAYSFFVSAYAVEAVPELYSEYASAYGIDERIYFCVAKQESGIGIDGKIIPWPWSLNIKGVSYRFNTKEEALLKIREALKTTESIDIGLFQPNWYWNKSYFNDPEELLDIHTNMSFAAWKLQQFIFNGKSYEDAVMDYHAPNKERKQRRYKYLSQVVKKCEIHF